MSLLTTCIYLATCLLKIIVVIEFCIFSSFVDHISVLISKNSFFWYPTASQTHFLVIVALWGKISQDCLRRWSRCLQGKTFLLPPFQSEYLVFLFLAWLPSLGLPYDTKWQWWEHVSCLVLISGWSGGLLPPGTVLLPGSRGCPLSSWAVLWEFLISWCNFLLQEARKSYTN